MSSDCDVRVCSICHEQGEGMLSCRASYKHCFCAECLARWVREQLSQGKTQVTCPVCRVEHFAWPEFGHFQFDGGGALVVNT